MNPSQQQTTAATEAKAADLLDKIAEETARIGARYMPTLTVKQFTEREKMLAELKAMLVEGTDYGTIPGTPKPTLYQRQHEPKRGFNLASCLAHVYDLILGRSSDQK